MDAGAGCVDVHRIDRFCGSEDDASIIPNEDINLSITITIPVRSVHGSSPLFSFLTAR